MHEILCARKPTSPNTKSVLDSQPHHSPKVPQRPNPSAAPEYDSLRTAATLRFGLNLRPSGFEQPGGYLGVGPGGYLIFVAGNVAGDLRLQYVGFSSTTGEADVLG